MARVVHLFKGAHADLAATTIARQLEAGDDVTVALLPGAAGAPALPAGTTVRRVPAELSYAALLDLVFAADHVLTW